MTLDKVLRGMKNGKSPRHDTTLNRCLNADVKRGKKNLFKFIHLWLLGNSGSGWDRVGGEDVGMQSARA